MTPRNIQDGATKKGSRCQQGGFENFGIWWKNFDDFRIFSIFGTRGWCHFFISEVSQLKGEFFKSKGIQFDLHWEIPLTIHYRVVGCANSNTPWVATHQVDLHVTYVPLSAPVNFSNARRGVGVEVWGDLMFEVFEARTTGNLNQLLPFFLFKRVFLQMIFCWMLTTFDEPWTLQDDLLYRGE